MITTERRDHLMGLEAALQAEVLGQDDAMRVLARALVRGELGLLGHQRPRSFLLLLGETGVGKTESVLSAGRWLYGSENYVIRLDMAEYADRAMALRRLLGSGPGDKGLLARELGPSTELGSGPSAELGSGPSAGNRTKPSTSLGPGNGLSGTCAEPRRGILLLDEIEKAHPDVTRLFLGMEAARLTLADGEVLRLDGVHIICTSNLGSESARGLSGEVPYAFMRKVVEEEAREHFSSPVFARFTEVAVFRSLTYECQRKICELRLGRFLRQIERITHGRLRHDPSVVDYLMKRGYHRDLGARCLRNAIEREVGDAVAGYSGAWPGESLLLFPLAQHLQLRKIDPLADEVSSDFERSAQNCSQ